MEFKELKNKSQKELQKLLKSLREDLRSARFKIAAAQEKNVKKIKVIRKDIARILMLISNKSTNSEIVESKGNEDGLNKDIDIKVPSVK